MDLKVSVLEMYYIYFFISFIYYNLWKNYYSNVNLLSSPKYSYSILSYSLDKKVRLKKYIYMK